MGTLQLDRQPSSVTFSKAGQYAVQLIVTNSTGCADTVIRTVQAYPLPALDAGLDQVICRGATASLSAPEPILTSGKPIIH